MVTVVILGVMVVSSRLSSSPASGLPPDPYAVSRFRSSGNWAGFIVCCANDTVTDVSATWTVPYVTCPSQLTTTEAVAIWVGIDGAIGASRDIEQTGTLIKCSPGSQNATYYAFFEWYPAPTYVLRAPHNVGPSDVIRADVKWQSGQFTASLQDTSRLWSFSTSNSTEVSRASAEWIVEAPSENGTTLLSPDFGKAYFSHCTATIDGVTGSMGSFQLTQDTMILYGSNIGAQPVLPLYNDGTSFSVWWTGQ